MTKKYSLNYSDISMEDLSEFVDFVIQSDLDIDNLSEAEIKLIAINFPEILKEEV